LVSGKETLAYAAWLGVYQLATPARRGQRCCREERSGRVARSSSQPWGAAYNGGDCTGTERLVMTPSIWLERTDARVSLQEELIGQLAWRVDVGLRSKLQIEHGPLCLNLSAR
jgi:hypothetical protein